MIVRTRASLRFPFGPAARFAALLAVQTITYYILVTVVFN